MHARLTKSCAIVQTERNRFEEDCLSLVAYCVHTELHRGCDSYDQCVFSAMFSQQTGKKVAKKSLDLALVRAEQFAVQPRTGIIPVAVCSCGGNAQSSGGFIDIQAGEVPQPDKLEYGEVFAFQLAEGIVNRQQLVGCCAGGDIDVINIKSAAPRHLFLASLHTGLIDQNAPHRFGCCGKEVAAIIPAFPVFSTDQTQIRLMHQSCGLQSLPGLFLGKFMSSQFAQFRVDQGQQLFRWPASP